MYPVFKNVNSSPSNNLSDVNMIIMHMHQCTVEWTIFIFLDYLFPCFA